MRTVTLTAINAVAVPLYVGGVLSLSVVALVDGSAALDANVKLKGSEVWSPTKGTVSSSDSVPVTICCLGIYMTLVDIAEPFGVKGGYLLHAASLGP